MTRLSHFLALITLMVVVACSDQGPVLSDLPAPGGIDNMLTCTATVATRSLACDSPNPAAAKGLSFNIQRGGPQGRYIRLTNTPPTYSGTDFSAAVTLRNESAQPLGTDGTTEDPEGIRVFFLSGPVGTGGTVTVANPDGTATITAAGQQFFRYAALDTNEASAPKTWTFNVPAEVTSFTFSVGFDARAPRENAVLDWAQLSIGTAPFDEIAEACGELWAVGGTAEQAGPPVVPEAGIIQHYNGTAWAEQDVPDGAEILHSIDMHCDGGTATGVAVGNQGTVLYYNGTTWSDVGPNGTATLMSVSRAGTEWWACGLDGVIIHAATPNGTWTAQESNTDMDLYVCGGDAANDVYAAGEGGLLTHYDGQDWDPTGYSSGTTSTIRAAVTSGTQIWLLGDGGTITHSTDGANFTAQASGTTSNLYGAASLSDATVDLYAVGLNGRILHYNGTSWATQWSGRDDARNDVVIRTNDDGSFLDAWSVGNEGVVLHGTR